MYGTSGELYINLYLTLQTLIQEWEDSNTLNNRMHTLLEQLLHVLFYGEYTSSLSYLKHSASQGQDKYWSSQMCSISNHLLVGDVHSTSLAKIWSDRCLNTEVIFHEIHLRVSCQKGILAYLHNQ